MSWSDKLLLSLIWLASALTACVIIWAIASAVYVAWKGGSE